MLKEIDIPPERWSDKGTLSFCFKLSRDLQFRPEPVAFNFVETPLFLLNLTETRHSVELQVSLKHDGSISAEGAKDILEGALDWAFLKANQTYHFAITWDAPAGKLDVYLNGTLQEELRIRKNAPAWPVPKTLSGPLLFHSILFPDSGENMLKIEFPEFGVSTICESAEKICAQAEASADFPNFPLTGEGRWEHTHPLDLSGYQLTPIYQADFSAPLNVEKEADLFKDGERWREPQSEWLLEGVGEALTKDGTCMVESNPRDFGHALVLWNTRPFPRNILIEFTMEPENPSKGLGIVFFATRNLSEGSPFAPGLPERRGRFDRYHSGELNGYHVSYWSANSRTGNILRRTSNLRKNQGFVLCSVGADHIGGAAPDPRLVRILSVDGLIQVETDGRLVLSFQDDGTFFGPPHADGWIGLRQMGSADRITYHDFRVSEVHPIA